MNNGIVKLSDILPVGLLADLQERRRIEKNHSGELTEKIAPHPTPPRVVGDPTRTPVNLQAARLLFKSSWLYQPLPPALEQKPELETLREENARLRATNENIVRENSALRGRIERLSKLVKQPAPKVVIPKPFVPPPPSPKVKELLERLQNVK